MTLHFLVYGLQKRFVVECVYSVAAVDDALAAYHIMRFKSGGKLGALREHVCVKRLEWLGNKFVYCMMGGSKRKKHCCSTVVVC